MIAYNLSFGSGTFRFAVPRIWNFSPRLSAFANPSHFLLLNAIRSEDSLFPVSLGLLHLQELTLQRALNL